MPITFYSGQSKINSGYSFIGPRSIVTSGLTLHLDPGNASSYPGSGTTWFDLSGNDYDGTLTNAPIYSSTTNGGIFTFNGTDEYVDMNGYAGLNTGEVTYQIWVRDTAPTDGNNHQIIARTNTNAGTFNILKRNTGLWGANLRLAADPGTQYNEDSTTSATTSWTNLAITYDGTDFRMYVNATQEATMTAAGAMDTSGTFVMNIARNTTNAAYFPGDIGVVLIYNRGISGTEVTQNYNALSSRYV